MSQEEKPKRRKLSTNELVLLAMVVVGLFFVAIRWEWVKTQFVEAFGHYFDGSAPVE